MITIDEEVKKRMKEQRLLQYQQQIYTLQMDITALKAIGDETEASKHVKTLEDVEKAYKAVEEM